MKRIVSLFFALLLAATMPRALGAEAIKKKRIGTPEDSVLVIGGIWELYSIRFTQVDPDFEPAYYESNDMLYIFDNVEPGSYLKVTAYKRREGFFDVLYSPGLSGKSTLDFRVPDKPGLYYAGYNMTLSGCERNVLIFKSVTKESTELMVLTDLLPYIRNKAWVPVIENRIKELENEGK